VNLPVGVLGGVFRNTSASHVDVREDDISRVGHQRVPLRAVSELEIRDAAAMETDGAEKNGTQDVDVLCIQIIPCLTVTVESSTTIDIHVFSAELEEGCGILEGLVETILLPVISVVCELDCALDILYAISTHVPKYWS
jgi:hypothetical protein